MLKLMWSLLLTLTIAANLKAQNDLPCFDSSEGCVQKLTAEAVANSEEIKVLDQTIKLAKRKGWTQYIDVSAIDPLTLSVQILRNIFGGGERQQRKLSITQIELRRTETVSRIRTEISNLLVSAENAERKRLQSKMLYDAQSSLVAVLEISYKSGELSTERMMPVWEKLDYYRIEIQTFETERDTIRKKLIVLIEPKLVVEITREAARTQLIKDIENAWKLSGTTEKLNLIVLDADEKRRVTKARF